MNGIKMDESQRQIKVNTAGTIIKGGEIQNVPTSGTTTLTQEMAQVLEQSVLVQAPGPLTARPKVSQKPPTKPNKKS